MSNDISGVNTVLMEVQPDVARIWGCPYPVLGKNESPAFLAGEPHFNPPARALPNAIPAGMIGIGSWKSFRADA